MSYQLLATDMDGTFLNKKKHLPPENARAVNLALGNGAHVVFCSGRCLVELEEFFPVFPDMRYVITESGAGVYDRKDQEFIHYEAIKPDYIREIIEYIEDKDIMPQYMMDGQSIISERHLKMLEHYSMNHYAEHFEKTARKVKDASSYCRDHGYRAGKICLYHTDGQAREETEKKLKHLPLVLAYSDKTSLEVSPMGIDKGSALKVLCRHLEIPLSDSIAIGDDYNDLSMLKIAGLSAAMGNAIPPVKEICDIVVSDCDHDGVAEVIKDHLIRG